MKRMSCAPVAIKPPPLIVAGLLPSPLALSEPFSPEQSQKGAARGGGGAGGGGDGGAGGGKGEMPRGDRRAPERRQEGMRPE